MTTGKRAFTGESQASLIHAIMGVDPPAMSSLQVMSPPALDQIVKTCLAPQTPILRVCRVWHRARSSVYARRQATRSPAPCRRRGPIGAAPDDVLFTPPGAWLVATRRGVFARPMADRAILFIDGNNWVSRDQTSQDR